MLYSGKKFTTKKINILTLVLSEKKFLNETKNHNPPFKLNGRSLRRQIWKCQSGYQKLKIEGHKIQLPKEKGQTVVCILNFEILDNSYIYL
jgi:hypothetical protein